MRLWGVRERHLPRPLPSDSSAFERITLLRARRCRRIVADGQPRVDERRRRLRTFGDENVQPTAGVLTINHAGETQVFGRQKTN